MGKRFSPGDQLFAADANTWLQAWTIAEPNVVGGGSIGPGGVVEFSSATALNINTVFGDGYGFYRIILDCTGTASTVGLVLRAGTSNSTTNYDTTRLTAANSTATSATLLNQSSALISGGLTNTNILATIDIARPNQAAPTSMYAVCGVQANPALTNANNGVAYTYTTHRLSTAYNGLRVVFSAAQSGTMRFYGYN